MTRDDIIRMARKAGFMLVTENPHPEGGGWHECFEQDIEYFAALVAAAERERIIEKNAPVIEQINAHMKEAVAAEREALIALLKGIDQTETESPDGWWETSTGADFGAGILAAIRARGEKA